MLAAVVYLLLPGHSIGQTVKFEFQPSGGNFCAPAQIKFAPTFSETPLTFYWETGIRDEESYELSPLLTYTVPGTYKVTLVVLFRNKLVEFTQPITVYGNPVLAITPDRKSICQPGSVNFSMTSSSKLTTTTWDFGDGDTITLPGNGQPVDHLYKDYGSFPVTVTATDSRGCAGNGSYTFNVQRPTAELSVSPTEGCLPVDVLFKAKISVPEGSTVTRFLWDFKDGSPQVSSTSNEILHTFNMPDTLIPSVSITTSDGCTNSFDFNPLSFGSKPVVPALSVNKPVGCASEKMYFTASGTQANKFYWVFDNGSLATTSLELSTIDSVLEYEFESLGDFSIRVVAENNGCKSDLSDSVDVSIVGVIADFSFNNTCAEKNRFNFRNNSEGTVNRINWTFINNTNTSGQARPTFVFPNQGSFPVSMIVTNTASGCSDTASTTIFTALPQFLPSDSFVCLGNTLSLRISNSYPSSRTSYIWTVGGRNYPSNADSNFSVPLNVAGEFINRVVINNGSGYCRDTLIQSNLVKVSGPTANIISNSTNCLSDKIVITDGSSVATQANPLVAWNWDFGNGMFSTDQHPQPVKYGASGNYTLSLTVEDAKGCKSSATRKLRIYRQPLLRIVPRPEKVCQAEDVTLFALHKNPIIWSSPMPIPCDTCSSIVVKPMAPTKVMVKSTDGNGCTSVDSVSFDVWMSFDLPAGVLRDTSICLGARVPFDLKLSGKLINWLPAPGLSSYDISNPVANPEVTTKYTVTVSDSGKCFTRTASAVVEVNPFPMIDPGPDLVLPYNTPFTIKPTYSNGVASYAWQPANLLSCSNCPEPSGIATTSTLFTVNVVSDKGCKSSARIKLTLDCSEKNLLMPTAFTPNNDGLNDYFYPLTRGISIIRRFVIYNRMGELVYENKNFKPNDRNMGWNGLFNGKVQPSGSFVYFVEAECDMGNTLSTKGNIVLMR